MRISITATLFLVVVFIICNDVSAQKYEKNKRITSSEEGSYNNKEWPKDSRKKSKNAKYYDKSNDGKFRSSDGAGSTIGEDNPSAESDRTVNFKKSPEKRKKSESSWENEKKYNKLSQPVKKSKSTTTIDISFDDFADSDADSSSSNPSSSNFDSHRKDANRKSRKTKREFSQENEKINRKSQDESSQRNCKREKPNNKNKSWDKNESSKRGKKLETENDQLYYNDCRLKGSKQCAKDKSIQNQETGKSRENLSEKYDDNNDESHLEFEEDDETSAQIDDGETQNENSENTENEMNYEEIVTCSSRINNEL